MWIVLIFILGYIAIALEHPVRINKAATALITGALCWTIYIVTGTDRDSISAMLLHELGDIASILFFLLGAMTIVELVDAHDGFEVITNRIRTTNLRKLLWVIALLAFFLSAVLDNLTTAIVMVSLLRRLIEKKEQRLMFAAMVIIAANAGGAWSPIGDVTTTMLWIGGQITPLNIMMKLFFPAIISLIVPLVIVTFLVKGEAVKPARISYSSTPSLPPAKLWQRNLVFFTGIGALLFVPLFKALTHLPPFMGMLLGLGVLWVITEMIHHEKDEADRDVLSVSYALRKIDTPSILFFLGILVAISALQTAGHLQLLSIWMNEHIGNQSAIVMLIGALSAVVDNVPLVAASMGMYDQHTYPPDSYLWEFLAYAAGTGGSMLIIGSAAGVAVMGMEKIDFLWYAKRIAWIAALGYLAGAFVYMGLENFFHLN